MKTQNLLYARDIPINQHISVRIPLVGEILDDEDGYYELMSRFIATPIDYMVSLDDCGVDFTTIDDYTLFLGLFMGIREEDTSLILGDLDLSKFQYAISEQNGLPLLVDTENDIKIDKAIHNMIAATLRKIHNIKKDTRVPGNQEAKEYMIERARKKLMRNRNRKQDSQLESLIVAMVSTEQFKYDFAGTRELTIYQFNESVRQIIKKVEYDSVMYGVYSGTVNTKDLSPDDLNWLIHK